MPNIIDVSAADGKASSLRLSNNAMASSGPCSQKPNYSEHKDEACTVCAREHEKSRGERSTEDTKRSLEKRNGATNGCDDTTRAGGASSGSIVELLSQFPSESVTQNQIFPPGVVDWGDKCLRCKYHVIWTISTNSLDMICD